MWINFAIFQRSPDSQETEQRPCNVLEWYFHCTILGIKKQQNCWIGIWSSGMFCVLLFSLLPNNEAAQKYQRLLFFSASQRLMFCCPHFFSWGMNILMFSLGLRCRRGTAVASKARDHAFSAPWLILFFIRKSGRTSEGKSAADMVLEKKPKKPEVYEAWRYLRYKFDPN